MTNKKIGNDFESDFCEILFNEGFWVHNMAQNASGQPADVIAVKNGKAYLIDCKICTGDSFAFSRLEDNQISSMDLWKSCGNGEGWFAVKFQTSIYMVSHITMVMEALNGKRRRKENWFAAVGMTLRDWVLSISPKQGVTD